MVTANGPYVGGVGQSPCRIMLVGEAPGRDEAFDYAYYGYAEPTPFIGPSGQEQDRFLRHSGLHRNRMYLTNLVKCYIDGNTDPTPGDVAAFEDVLYDELLSVRPEFIITVGAFATRWFLGDDCDMETVYGLPQRSQRRGCGGAVIIPTYHPAFGLYSPENKPIVYYGYQQAGRIIRGEVSSAPVYDEYPDPTYADWDGEDDILTADIIAVDTEGDLDDHSLWWGFSATATPGSGYVFRRADPEFSNKLRAFREAYDRRVPLAVMHNALGIDIDTFRHIGIDFAYRPVYDTMVAAYMLRLEPQGLKPLARRWCGMEMTTYPDIIGDVAYAKQRAYLETIRDTLTRLKPEPRLIYENDGTARIYKPQSPSTRAAKILADIDAGKEVVIPARWKGVDRIERVAVAQHIGPMPIATLDDVPLDRAIRYSGRDPDATLRLYLRIREAIASGKLTDRCLLDQEVLPVLEEMQHTGFMASRSYFTRLSSDMQERMNTLQSQISHRFNDDQPFNPMSQPQVAGMLAKLGIKGVKKTKSKKMSTSKKSLEHLRNDMEFVGLMFDWREHQKVKTSFADPIAGLWAENGVEDDTAPVCCTIRSTRVESGRISAANPNLTAIPVGTDEHGPHAKVRGGFTVPPPLKFFGADMSQIEMRVLADLSGDPFLCKLFREGRDIHSETCIKIFGLAPGHQDGDTGEWRYPSVNKFIRNPTKRAGFGVITGISGLGLHDQIRMMKVDIPKFCAAMGEDDPVDACDKLIEEWFKTYPGARNFLLKCRDKAEHDGFVREQGGLPKYLPGIWDLSRGGDNPIRAAAQREAHSHIISGTAQTMLRQAMVWLKPQILSLRQEVGLPLNWTMQIHDEIIFTGHEIYEDVLQPLVIEALTKHAGYMRVPIEASWSSANSWDKLK